jgi:hypothetical protein
MKPLTIEHLIGRKFICSYIPQEITKGYHSHDTKTNNIETIRGKSLMLQKGCSLPCTKQEIYKSLGKNLFCYKHGMTKMSPENDKYNLLPLPMKLKK